MLRTLAIFLLAAAVLSLAGCKKSNDNATGPDGGTSITVGQVDGSAGSGTIHAGQTITVHFTYSNSTGKAVIAFTNGFKVYSPDGAQWGGSMGDTTGISHSMFDLIVSINEFSANGSGADTIGFGGVSVSGSGLPDGFDADGVTVSFGPVSAGYAGHRVCIDSVFYPPGGEWLWVLNGQVNVKPSWGGPYCWTVVSP